jgi:epoxide hydrolase-like predicted phosphatase
MDAVANLGVEPSEVTRVYLKSDEMNYQYKLGKITDDQFWTWAAEQWGIDKSSAELIAMMIDAYQVDQKVAETVRKVRSAGYKTLICTNNFPARMNGLQAKFGFLNDFDVVVSSHQVGFPKPTKEIFEILVEKSGVEPSEIVFADDNESSLAGATELGINTFVYKDFDQFISELSDLGVDLYSTRA